MKPLFQTALLLAFICTLCGCKVDMKQGGMDDPGQPLYLELINSDVGTLAISVSPFDGLRDTLVIDRPLTNLIVMSTSHVGFLDALDALDCVSGISGKDFIFTSQKVLENEDIADVGYDAAPDYEKIVELKPDLLLTYTVSGAKSPFIKKLEQLGIAVFIVNEHLESHPLARASYIRLFGALTGRMPQADSIFNAVKESYSLIADSIATAQVPRRKVLLNIPYNDQWFVPSSQSYLTSLIRDAGGEVLGCEEGRAASSVMPVEKAYSLSKEADCWLNVGWCTTLSQLLSVNPVFEDMVDNIQDNALKEGYGSFPAIWNDNKRVNSKGGNDIWQSGVARPDLLLKDLVTVLHPDNQREAASTIYYRPIE
ncbi:MAG: ABC transporter substrate-binding protein [Bacteroidales bacterium]|nr:ABC transporter substrate-binding protein [Bacteroidales bacterium]